MGNYLSWKYPISTLSWDKVLVERDSGVGYVEIVELDIGISQYHDSTGTSTDKYRYRFKDSVTLIYSDYAILPFVSTYAVPYDLREQLPSLLLDEAVITGQSSSSLLLSKNAYGVYSVERNGTILPTSGFTFTKPRTVTLTVAATPADVFSIISAIGKHDQPLLNILVDVTFSMDNIIAKRAALPVTPTSNLSMICSKWAAGEFLLRHAAANEENVEKASALLSTSRDLLNDYFDHYYKKIFIVETNDDIFLERSEVTTGIPQL